MASLFILTILALNLFIATSTAQLRENFYAKTCPRVESIVTQAVKQKVKQTFVTIPGTLRLFFHDCFVQGCDASVMIASTPNNKAEKDSQDNLSLAGDGFDTVIKAKQAVEKACPKTVSCADILALATRDVVVSAGGPWYSVELGRRDGRVSTASNCAGNLPKATFNVNQLLANFNKKNLGLADLVALSAAHTLGFSHCNQFANRVYGSRPDKTLNVQYALQLKQMCPRRVDPTIAINMDPTTPRKFDNVYYKNLKQGKGLFNSDQALYTDGRTRPLVDLYASNPGAFNNAFKEAMRRMGRVGVKVSNQGEIRLDCGRIN